MRVWGLDAAGKSGHVPGSGPPTERSFAAQATTKPAKEKGPSAAVKENQARAAQFLDTKEGAAEKLERLEAQVRANGGAPARVYPRPPGRPRRNFRRANGQEQRARLIATHL